MKKASLAVVALAALCLAGAGWYLWWPSQPPAGQPGLTVLDADDFDGFRRAFNASVNGPRVVVLLSPT